MSRNPDTRTHVIPRIVAGLAAVGLCLVASGLLLPGTARAEFTFDFGRPPMIKPRIKILSAETVRQYHTPSWSYYLAAKPLPGQSFHVKVRYQVTGVMPTPFKIRISLPGNNVTEHMVYSSSATVAFVPMRGVDLQEDVNYIAQVDTENKAGESFFQRFDNWMMRTLSFNYPSLAIEKYDTKSYSGYQELEVTFSGSGSVSQVLATFGVPESYVNSHQTVTYLSGHYTVDSNYFSGLTKYVGAVNSMPYYSRVYQMDPTTYISSGSKVTFDSTYEVDLSSIRVNPTILDSVTWPQVDAWLGINYYNAWTGTDGAVIAPNAPEVASFVTAALGTNHRSTYTPYKAARQLFIAVNNHMVYSVSLPSHTTVDVIKNGTGDCGAYAMLWVAALRHIGIPARTVSGDNAGGGNHAWGEFYLPGVGWVPGDPSASDKRWPNSGVPYHFGSIAHINRHSLTARGNRFEIGGLTYHWLQHPALHVTGSMPHTSLLSFGLVQN
jgi:transglutaminase-like putative cysteine protease